MRSKPQILDYAQTPPSLVRRLLAALRRRKRLLLVTLTIVLLMSISAPVSLVYYGKYAWRRALAGSRIDLSSGEMVLRYDGFLLGGDRLTRGAWGVRYKLCPAGETNGFEFYLFVYPRFLAIDAPIFHT